MKRYRVAIIALVLGASAACSDDVTKAPDALLSRWHAKDPQMRGRALEIRPDWVVFVAGAYSQKMYPIVRVEEERHLEGTHYTLHYRGDGNQERQLGLLLREGNPRSIQLDNRDERWVRTQDASWLREKETS